MGDFFRTIKYGSKDKVIIIPLMILIFAITAAQLAEPQILKNIFNLIEVNIKDNQSVNHQLGNYWLYIGIFAGLIIFESLCWIIRNYIFDLWATRLRIRVQMEVFNHMETLSLEYFEKNQAGKIKEKIEKGVDDLINIIETVLMEIIPQIFYVIAATILLFTVNKYFGLIILIGVPIFITISLVFIKKLNFLQDKVRNAEEKASGGIIETIVNIRTVKSFVTEAMHSNRLKRELESSKKNTMKRALERQKMNTLRFFVSNLSQITIIALGTYWAITGKITLGIFVLAWSYTNRSFGPLWYLMWMTDRVQKNLRSVKRTFELMDTEPGIVDIKEAKKIKIKKSRIEFKNVQFKYNEGNKKIINNISLNINPGKAVAFVGRSGVGKSTIVKLLLRFYEPQKGKICIDGQNINKVTQKSLRENIGIVMQDAALFNDTAYNNIAYGTKKYKKAAVIKAAKAANAHDFITKLPKGYETEIGERGVRLSGGEQQRINIARAILKDPPILILDEATSSLDSESENLIQDALWKLIEGRTTIIIAHRLSTVMRADLIVVLDKGKISDMDEHKNLLKREGIYSKLFKMQSGGYLK